MLSRFKEFLFRLTKEGRALTKAEKDFEKSQARLKIILATRAPTIPASKNRRKHIQHVE